MMHKPCITLEQLQKIFVLTFVISSFCFIDSHNMYLGLALYLIRFLGLD